MRENQILWDGEIKRDLSHKKKVCKRRFVIEHKYAKRLFVWRTDWRVYQKYMTEKAARQAMQSFMKNHNYGRPGYLVREYKAKSCPEEIMRFGVFLKGALEEEFRLLEVLK